VFIFLGYKRSKLMKVCQAATAKATTVVKAVKVITMSASAPNMLKGSACVRTEALSPKEPQQEACKSH
jgi:hypothetical protein